MTGSTIASPPMGSNPLPTTTSNEASESKATSAASTTVKNSVEATSKGTIFHRLSRPLANLFSNIGKFFTRVGEAIAKMVRALIPCKKNHSSENIKNNDKENPKSIQVKQVINKVATTELAEKKENLISNKTAIKVNINNKNASIVGVNESHPLQSNVNSKSKDTADTMLEKGSEKLSEKANTETDASKTENTVHSDQATNSILDKTILNANNNQGGDGSQDAGETTQLDTTSAKLKAENTFSVDSLDTSNLFKNKQNDNSNDNTGVTSIKAQQNLNGSIAEVAAGTADDTQAALIKTEQNLNESATDVTADAATDTKAAAIKTQQLRNLPKQMLNSVRNIFKTKGK